MKALFTLGLLLVSGSAFADAVSVLTIQRTNYKPEKRLVYDLNINKSNCQIDTANPFDTYYRENSSGKRLPDFSSNSRDYFGPRIDSRKLGPNMVALQFKAFDEVQNATGEPAEILIYSESVSGACTFRTEITYSDKRYNLEHIDIKVKKTFGLPSGVEWVLLKGKDEKGAVNDCIVGNCR